MRIWDTRTCQQLAVAEGHLEPVRCVVFSPDGTQVGARGGGGRCDAIPATYLAPHMCPHFQVASASNDKTVKLWDVGSGTQVVTQHPILIHTFPHFHTFR